jgi:hypothetical protein
MINPLTEPQPPPLKNNYPYSIDGVIKDLTDRKNFGMNKYGTALQPNNGRNNLIDSYQELMDLLVYLRTEINETFTEPTELW